MTILIQYSCNFVMPYIFITFMRCETYVFFSKLVNYKTFKIQVYIYR